MKQCYYAKCADFAWLKFRVTRQPSSVLIAASACNDIRFSSIQQRIFIVLFLLVAPFDVLTSQMILLMLPLCNIFMISFFFSGSVCVCVWFFFIRSVRAHFADDNKLKKSFHRDGEWQSKRAREGEIERKRMKNKATTKKSAAKMDFLCKLRWMLATESKKFRLWIAHSNGKTGVLFLILRE